MSKLDNFYSSCPGLMADGRSQTTDYRSHNRLFKIMKGDTETSYDFREKLQGSGLRDMIEGMRFNMCGTVPGGDITLPAQINLNINAEGSYLDAFGSLKGSKSAPYFPETHTPTTSAVPTSTVFSPAPVITTSSMMAPVSAPTVAPTVAPMTTMFTTSAPTTNAPVVSVATTSAPTSMATTSAPTSMATTSAPVNGVVNMPTTGIINMPLTSTFIQTTGAPMQTTNSIV